jgi:hypothetical protein
MKSRQEARESYDVLERWTDEDFETAEENWKEACLMEWNTPEDADIQEPYHERFLDWCVG